ncbi:MAG: S8 family serine peptidase [Chitinophagaceae bacterium]
MRFILSTLFCALFIFNTDAQVKIYLKSGDFFNTNPEITPNNDANYFKDCIFENKYFLWLQFTELPTEIKKQELISAGIVFYEYLPSNTYVASFPLNFNFISLHSYNVYAVTKPSAPHKIDGTLFNPSQINWAVVGNNHLKINVSYLNVVSPNDFTKSLKEKGYKFTVVGHESTDIVVLEASIDEIKKIALHPLVQFIEPCTHPGLVEDIQGVTNHRTTYLQSSDNWVGGKKLDGTGVNIAIGDDGYIGPHIDFQGRLTNNATNTSAANTHSDHCSGIILGAGNLNPQVRGQAPGASLTTYDNYAPYNLFPSIYNTDKIRIVSHSLGQTCNSGYDANARTSDQLVRTYPSLMYVHSAGNSGNTSCGGMTGWYNITGGFKAGKNVMTVANLSKTDVADATSSRGPLKDGRIKPDIAAVGVNVNSTQPDNTFAVFSGTSMACPAVAGNMAVLYQAFKNKNTGVEPEANLIKGIALNTADDIGNPGPDYIYGWGRINMRKAVKCIEGVNYLSDNITTAVTKTHTITIPTNVSKAKIMVYWGDREANTSAARSLVNNLDAKIVDASLNEYLPWVLDIGAVPDATTIGNPAINGIDSINNVEQIELITPNAGNYTLRVNGKAVPFGPQKYYVIIHYDYVDEVVVTYPNGGESFSTNESQRIRWDANNSFNTFKVEYSINDGSTWSTINAAVASDRRYVDWTVPSTVTTKTARIRVTQGTSSDVSDTSFIILRVPGGISFTDICAGTTKISWSTVTGAVEYDVLRLGGKYMDVVATTTATNVTLNNVGDTLNWFAVRAKLGSSSQNGRRSNAVSYTNSSVVVCPVPVKLISFIASQKNNSIELAWLVANEENMLNYVVEKSITPTFEKVEMVGQITPTNKPFNQQYKLTDNNIATSKVWYYRLKMVDVFKSLYSNVQQIKLEKNIVASYTISPNPAKNVINIYSSESIANAVVKIYNEIGIEVVTKNILSWQMGEKYSFNTSNLPSGNYFVNIINAKNGVVTFKQQISVVK